MNVTPLDIQQKQFQVAFRGYEKAEVDLFLGMVREEMEALVREVTELREFRQIFEERMKEFREREETLKNTMISTHKLAEDIKESSRKEAALIVKDAEIRSQQMLEKAKEEKSRLEADLQELKRKRHHLLQDMKKVLQMHLEMVNYEETSGEGAKEKSNNAG